MNPQNIAHHIDDELIWDYSCGKTGFAESLIIRAHIGMCSECRKTLEVFQIAGGELLEQREGIALAPDALNKTMARIEVKDKIIINNNKPIFHGHLLPDNFAKVKFAKRRYLGPNVWIAPLLEEKSQSQTYLLWVKAGMNILPHTHTDREITLVLEGGFTDGDKTFNKGDIHICDNSLNHAPSILADEDCLCIVYQDGPIKPNTILGHLLKPFAKI